LCFINYPGNQVKKDVIGGACSTYGERRGAYRVQVGKSEGKRPLERNGVSWWEDNIKVDLKGLKWEGVDWIDAS
jgi:hypothetical protein